MKDLHVGWVLLGLAAALGCSGDSTRSGPPGGHTAGDGGTPRARGDAGLRAAGGTSTTAGGAAGTSTGSGGERAGGAGDSGRSGGSGNTGGHPESADGGPDASASDVIAPAKPDLTGLVSTSGKWVLFWGTSASSSLVLFDIESGTQHAMNDGGPSPDWTGLSPDGAVFLFSGSNASLDMNLRIVHLTDQGAVPARWVQGFQGVRGNFASPRFSSDCRFAAILRGFNNGGGAEIIDAVLDERVGGFPLEGNFGASFAPAGYAFQFWQAPENRVATSYYARVTAKGLSASTQLPPNSASAVFDGTGNRAYYSVTSGGTSALYYDDLAAGTNSTTVPLDASLGTVTGSFSVGAGDSLFVYSTHSDGNQAYSRISAAGGLSPLVLSDPSRSVYLAATSRDGKTILLDYKTSADLVRVEPYQRVSVLGTPIADSRGFFQFGMVGDHAYYRAADGLHFAQLDAKGAITDVAVVGASDDSTLCTRPDGPLPPASRAVLQSQDSKTLTFIDASAPAAKVAGQLTPSLAGGRFSCPVWTADGAAFGVVELGSGGITKLYVVPWSGSTPATPRTFDVDGAVVFALSYR